MKYSLGIEKDGKFVEILTGSLKEIDERLMTIDDYI